MVRRMTSSELEALAEKMVNYRARHGMSQKDLAQACNITLQTVNSVESCRQTPTALTTAKIKLVVERDEK